jgi:hypothetical protein
MCHLAYTITKKSRYRISHGLRGNKKMRCILLSQSKWTAIHLYNEIIKIRLSPRNEIAHCIRIPNSHYVLINSNQFRFGRIKCLVPLNIWYWTAKPAINYNCNYMLSKTNTRNLQLVMTFIYRRGLVPLQHIPIKSCKLRLTHTMQFWKLH